MKSTTYYIQHKKGIFDTISTGINIHKPDQHFIAMLYFTIFIKRTRPVLKIIDSTSVTHGTQRRGRHFMAAFCLFFSDHDCIKFLHKCWYCMSFNVLDLHNLITLGVPVINEK